MSLLAFVIQLLPAFAILSDVVVFSVNVSFDIPHQIQRFRLLLVYHMAVVNRSSDHLTHIRKINNHSRPLKIVQKSSGGSKECFAGDNVARLHSVSHSLIAIAQCRLHHSISPQSVIGRW